MRDVYLDEDHHGNRILNADLTQIGPEWLHPDVMTVGQNTTLKSILDYGADPDGTFLCDAAFAAFMADDTTAEVRVPVGVYLISEPIVMRSGKSLIGEAGSRDGTYKQSWILQTTDSEFVTGVDIRGVTLRELFFSPQFPESHTKDGIVFTRSEHAATNYVTFDNIHVYQAGRDGIVMSNLIVSSWRGVNAINAGRHGFNFYGVENGAAGTSVSLDACYANTCGVKEVGHGFKVRKMTYMSFTGCASEGNTGSNYHVTQCQGIALNGCGSEFPLGVSSFFLGDGCLGVVLTGCWSYANSGVAFDVTGPDTTVQLVGCVEMDPEPGAVYAFRTGGGANVTLVGATHSTANLLDPSTVVVSGAAGQVAAQTARFGSATIDGPGHAVLGVNRASGASFGQIEFQTGGSTDNGWALTHLASTNHLRFFNFGSGRNGLLLDAAGKYVDVSWQRVIKVLDPVEPTDAATKQYVDDRFVVAAERPIDPPVGTMWIPEG